MHILHLALMELPGPALRRLPKQVESAVWTCGCNYASLKEQKDALDNLCGSAGVMGVGDGHLLHRWRPDSPPVGLCVDRHADPLDSGTQGSWLAPRLASGVLLEVAGEGTKMPLLTIVVTLVVIGVVLYLINNYIPMASGIKTLLNVVVVVVAAVWVLQVFGLWGRVTSYRFVH
jgi:hypothetical protein